MFLKKEFFLVFLLLILPYTIFCKDYSATGYGKDPTSAKLSSIDELIEVLKKDYFNSDSDLYNNFDLKRVVNGATFTSPNDTGSEDENLKYRIRATISDSYIRSSILLQDEQRKTLNNENTIVNKNVSQIKDQNNIQINTQISSTSIDNTQVINTPTLDTAVNTKFENFMNFQRENDVALVSLGSPIIMEETKDLYLTWDVGFKFFKPFKRYSDYPYASIDLIFGPTAGVGLIWSKGINFNLLIFPSFVKKTLYDDILGVITRTGLGTKYFRTYGELYLAYRFSWGSMDTNIGLSFGTDFDYFSEFFLQPKAILSIPVVKLHPVFDFVNVGIGGRYTFMSNDDANAKAWALNIEITLGGLF